MRHMTYQKRHGYVWKDDIMFIIFQGIHVIYLLSGKHGVCDKVWHVETVLGLHLKAETQCIISGMYSQLQYVEKCACL